MGRAFLEFLELAARYAGLHGLAYWFRDSPDVLPALVAGVVLIGIAIYLVGKAGTNPDDVSADDFTVMLRGGCLLVILGGLGLIFVAAVVWAWRFLFG